MKGSSVISLLIKEKAKQIGFDDCGISRVEYLEEEAGCLNKWIDQEMYAGMLYMKRNCDKRLDPAKLMEGAKSVISVILNYYPQQFQNDPDAPVISKYAYGKDYHSVIKGKLSNLLNFIEENIPGATGRAFVDSAPVMEHAWAKKAGLGWIGKNSLLLTKKFGSYVFIGELIVNIELDYNGKPVKDLCGNCTKCIDACPTKAIVSAGVVDARKCISYHTIENKTSDMPVALRGKFMNRVFGCDICQDVCPWNQSIDSNNTPDFNPDQEFLTMSSEDWLRLNKTTFNKLFKDTPLERAGYNGLKRNISFLSA